MISTTRISSTFTRVSTIFLSLSSLIRRRWKSEMMERGAMRLWRFKLLLQSGMGVMLTGLEMKGRITYGGVCRSVGRTYMSWVIGDAVTSDTCLRTGG